MSIHPTAIIDSKAEIASDVTISPYAVIGPDVKIDSGTWIGPHAVIEGPTTIGKDNKIFQFASVGADPQDKKYKGEPTTLTIGDRNLIRENCTINRGTVQAGGTTAVGDDNWIMAYVHIAHDCIIGNNTVFANNASIAGHVVIGDHVILGGFSLVLQFCHVGDYAFTGYGTGLSKDLPPYVMAFGTPSVPRSINSEGLKRHGYSDEDRKQLKNAYKTLYRKKLTLEEAIQELAESDNDKVKTMIKFLKESQTRRGIIR